MPEIQKMTAEQRYWLVGAAIYNTRSKLQFMNRELDRASTLRPPSEANVLLRPHQDG